MKTLLICFLGLVVCSLQLSAQKGQTFKINPGQKITDVIPASELYEYPQFIAGSILFKNGTFAKVPLNYNIFSEAMEFISQKGDTLAIADESTVKMIVIKQDTFYFSKAYVKSIGGYGDVMLAQKPFFSISNREKIGAMGTATSASADTHNAIRNKEVTKDLVVQDVLTLNKSRVFFIGNRFQYFLPVNKKNLLEMYGTRQKEVSKYLKENDVQFLVEEDVRRLMEHFNQ